VHNPHLPDNEQGSKRDLVGELTKAVRARGLRMGLYYSGGRDWTFTQEPYTVAHHEPKAYLNTDEYAQFTDAQMRELIDRYSPAILWDDIGYSSKGKLTEIFSDYYNRIPDGVINDRFTSEWADFTTPEYTSYDKITPRKWEANRGIGHSFGYNRAEGPAQMLSVHELVSSLADIVSKNGNLLLDIGPEADGTVSRLQLDRLTGLGDWLAMNGEAIFDTSPWIRAEGKTQGGTPIRFTQKNGVIYAILLEKPAGNSVTISDLPVTRTTRINILGSAADLHWSQAAGNITITLPDHLPGSQAWVLKIAAAPVTAAALGKPGTGRVSLPEL
jgi:alpha-L-fucosidase